MKCLHVNLFMPTIFFFLHTQHIISFYMKSIFLYVLWIYFYTSSKEFMMCYIKLGFFM